MAQRAEAAQHRRDQRPRQRAVALRQSGKRGAASALELFVEWAAAAQHAVEDIGGNAPGGEARQPRRRGCPEGRLGLARRAIGPSWHGSPAVGEAVNGRSGVAIPPCSRAAVAPSEGHAAADPKPPNFPPADAAEERAGKEAAFSPAAERALAEARPAAPPMTARRQIARRKSKGATAPNRPATATGKSRA